MTKLEAIKKLEELEARIRALEARPIVYPPVYIPQPYPVYPWPQPYYPCLPPVPYWQQPAWQQPQWGTITAGNTLGFGGTGNGVAMLVSQ
jgi:hypothetical protein